MNMLHWKVLLFPRGTGIGLASVVLFARVIVSPVEPAANFE
jgi:hypothetical protein